MDDDIYKALIGDAPSSAEQMAALASALRRKRSLGELGALTGDRVLSPFGNDQIKAADTAAVDVGTNVQRQRQAAAAAAEQAGLAAWRKSQTDNAEAQLAESKRAHDQEYEWQMLKAQQDKTAAAQAKIDAANERAVQQLASKLTTAKIPQVGASLANLNEVIKKNLLSKDQGGKGRSDLPGMGYAKNLPVAAFFLSKDGKEVKSAVQAVSNDLLNMYSGLAVTVPESERRSLEQMSDGKFSAEDFVSAWPTIVKRYNAVRHGLTGGFNPEVQKSYQDNGGMSLEDLKPYDPNAKEENPFLKMVPQK